MFSLPQVRIISFPVALLARQLRLPHQNSGFWPFSLAAAKAKIHQERLMMSIIPYISQIQNSVEIATGTRFLHAALEHVGRRPFHGFYWTEVPPSHAMCQPSSFQVTNRMQIRGQDFWGRRLRREAVARQSSPNVYISDWSGPTSFILNLQSWCQHINNLNIFAPGLRLCGLPRSMARNQRDGVKH